MSAAGPSTCGCSVKALPVIYIVLCSYATYLVGTAPGQDVTVWRLLAYAATLIGACLVGVHFRAAFVFVPVLIAVAWMVVEEASSAKLFDAWSTVGFAMFVFGQLFAFSIGWSTRKARRMSASEGTAR